MIFEALSLPFMQRVLAAGLLSGIAVGVIGTYVTVKRMSSVTGGLAHAAFGGVGLGYLLGINPMLSAAVFGVLSGAGIGIAYRRMGSALDTAISLFWTTGMALGVVFIALAPGYAPDLTTYLFGSILFVSWEYVGLVLALDVLILTTVALFYQQFQAIAFDEEFATVTGVAVDRLFLALMSLIALCVVTLIQVVGIILAIALLTLPAEAARPWARSLGQMMAMASIIASACTCSGALLSFALSDQYDLSIPTGPLVVLLTVAVYGLSVFGAAARSRAVQGGSA